MGGISDGVISFFFIASGLWCKRLRVYALVLGAAIMIGMDTYMSIDTFAYQMIALFFLFLPDVPWRRGAHQN